MPKKGNNNKIPYNAGNGNVIAVDGINLITGHAIGKDSISKGVDGRGIPTDDLISEGHSGGIPTSSAPSSVYPDLDWNGNAWSSSNQQDITYTYSRGANGGNNNPDGAHGTTNYSSITGAAMIDKINDAFDLYESVANVHFVNISDSGNLAKITIREADIGTAGVAGFADNPGDQNSDIVLDRSNGLTSRLITHEIGHSMGLQHPGGAGDNPNYDTTSTVMSYNGTGSKIMIYDIWALQQKYGGKHNTNRGDTIYTFDVSSVTSTDEFSGTKVITGNATIWDGDIDGVARRGSADTYGNHYTEDTYDASGMTQNMILDLREGIDYYSGRVGGAQKIWTAFGSNIDNAIGGSGDDLINGNQFDNKLTGGAGKDTMTGDMGDDTLTGGADADRFITGAGVGNDVIMDFDSTEGDVIVLDGVQEGEFSLSGNVFTFSSGSLTVNGSLVTDSDLVYSRIRIGDSGNNLLIGGEGNDTLKGRGGDDTLIAGDGDDSLNGGSDNDLLSYESATGAVGVNLLTGIHTSGAENDTISNIENLKGTDFGDSLRGDNNPNKLYGGAGADFLYGEKGYDTIYGGAGNDRIWGDHICCPTDETTGNDLYGEDGNDNILGADGADLLDGGADNDTLSGRGGDNTLRGGAGDDSLYGGDNDDEVYGGADDDLLYGKDGADTLNGGLGNDTIYGSYKFGGDDFAGDLYIFDYESGETDEIRKFETGMAGEIIDLSDPGFGAYSLSDLVIDDAGGSGDTTISGNNHTIILTSIAASITISPE